MRIIFTGSGEFGLPTLAALLQAGHELVGVFTQVDRPAGRGLKMTPTPIAQFALEHGLPLRRTDHLSAQELPPADLMVVIAFGQKLAPAAIDHPRLGSINLHASRLPQFRGAAPVNWAILSGQSVTGNSVIRLAEIMDAGAILAQSSLAIGETETAGELYGRLAKDGVELVLQVMGDLEAARAVETPQDDSVATTAPKLNRKSATIDWSARAAQIARKIRGLYPWPGCAVRVLDASGNEQGRLTLVRARPAAGEGSRWRPGEILVSGHVCAGEGNAVQILEVQPQGKRAMPLADYRRGNPWMPGMRLESI
ncbi:MAG: methionyl-tRNA formyltransferase [Tepidisphaeraceae bacterium]|jgi:methionyl-tRNA formyltransferase